MATATATRKPPKPVDPVIESITLVLSFEEACAVKAAVGNITGSAEVRNLNDYVYAALSRLIAFEDPVAERMRKQFKTAAVTA